MCALVAFVVTPSGERSSFSASAQTSKPQFRHPIDNPIAPLDCALTLAERMIVVRRFGQRSEISRFRNGEFVYRLVEEIDKRCRGNAICTKPQVDFVQVKFNILSLL